MKDPRIPFRSIWNNPGNRDRRLAKLWQAINWQFAKRSGGHPRIIRLPSGAFFKAYPDCVVSSSLIYADWPEFHELMFVRKMVAPRNMVIDVGANVGHIPLLLSDLVPPSQLVAFEPTPISFMRLEENWLLNDWPTENLYQVAIGEHEGASFINDTTTPETMNSIVEEATARTVPVKVRSLDSFLEMWRGREIGLLKIDVEGFEAAVFRGATRLLNLSPPRLVMFESLRGELDPAIKAVFDRAGYVVFQLSAEGEPEFGRAEAQNLFAVPAANVPAIQKQN